MGFDIANNSLEETCFIIAVVGVALAIIATALRFVAVHRSNRKFYWDDWFAVLATVFFILYIVPLLYLLSVMNGQNIEDLTKEDIMHIKKAGYSFGPQFCIQQLFAKLSLLFLYYRLFSVNRRFVYCVYVLGIIQLLWSISTALVHYFECIPVEKDWNPEIPGHCINEQAFLAAGETPNSLIDFALIALAAWMVQSLKLRTAVKMKLIVIFIIGGLAGILGFVKIGYGFSAVSASKVELLDPIWATVQQTCSIICCSAPVYKPLIPELGFLHRLRSLGSSIFNRSTKSAAQPPSKEVRTHENLGPGNWTRSDDWIPLNEHSTRETSKPQSYEEC